jgi:hypothetical protein
MPLCPKLLAAGCFAALLSTSCLAAAFEKQWHVGGGLGAGTFAESETSPGPLLGLHAAYGLSDMFDLKLETFAATHVRNHERLGLFSATAGVAYKVDVIEWIPYFGVQVGYYGFSGHERPGSLAAHELGLSFDLGLDYAVSRSFGLGAQLRYHGFMSDPMSSMADAAYFCALLRAEYRWGW